MFDLDRWQEIYETLRKNKMRTFLTAFGVFWGIFMLVVLMGAGNGLRNGVNDQMKGFATNSIFIWPQTTTIPYYGLPRGRNFSLTNDDVIALRNNIPELEYLAPKLGGGDGGNSDNVTYGLKSGKFNVSGDVPDWCKIDPVNIVYGRLLNEKDVTDSRKVVVIGNRVQEVLFEKNENPVGKYILIKGIWFQVIGSFKPKNQNINIGGDKQQSVYIPITTMQRAYNYGQNIGFVALTTKKGNSAADVGDKVIAMLKRRHTVAPNDKDAIGHFNLEELFNQVSGLFMGINLLVWVVGTGTLLAGVIGISNIMLVIVKERTKEIGIQRAIGAPPLVIMSQIITESVVLTAIAGFVGLSLGVGLLSLINMALTSNGGGEAPFKDPQVDFNMAISALVILIISGAFAGLLPALRAIKVRPIDALRYE
jgi:putative ABC transport system permease protein